MSRMLSKLLLVWMAVVCLGVRAYGSSLAYITVGGSEQQVSGAWDTGTATISFNGFVETVQYGQFSTPASIASAFAAMFSRDYLASGLCANASGATITFKLKGNATFGKLNIAGTGTSFQYASSGFLVQTASVVDVGTVGLFMKNPNSSSSDWIIASSTNYGAGATPTTIAQGLESGIKAGSFVNISANGDDLYLESKQVGSGTNYSYSIQTTSYDSAHFSQPSFANPAITGTLSGGANAGTSTGQTVYSYSATYDGVGNVMTYNDSVNGNWDMTGGYDSLNRLTGAHATSGTYKGDYFCWYFDAFGNRKQQTIASGAGFSNAAGATCQVGSGGTLLSNNWANYTTDGQSSSADNGKNWLTGTPLGTYSSTPVIGYYSYDAAGNLTSDAHNQYLYDGEGRVCAVLNDYGTMTGYIYDADGTRVAKGSIATFSCDLATNGFQTQNDYILGPGGEQMTEMAMDTDGSMYVAHNNVWAGGKLLATYDADGALHFYLTDALGSRRVMTNYAGIVEQNCQNLPYGDGENCGPTPTEHLFTGKERDSESGNDYFGARYYVSSMGRWMSPDPINLTNARLLNPANTLNKYVYGANNPLKYVDLDGKDITIFYIPPSNPFETGHVLVGAVNQDTGASAMMDFYPRVTSPSLIMFNVPEPGEFRDPSGDSLVASSLTIRTTPEEANTVIAAIKQLESGQPPNYQTFSNNCTTEVQDVLKDIGLINPGDWDPNQYWYHMYSNYSAAAMQNPFAAFGPTPHAEGHEYGNPRNFGMSYAELFFRLQTFSRTSEPKATVTTTECVTLPNGTKQCD